MAAPGGDDRTIVMAWSRRNGLGVDIPCTFGSDIGHWDVRRAEDVDEGMVVDLRLAVGVD